MKIIGRTEAGARLVEISTSELIEINAAAQTLNGISLGLGIVIPNPPAPEEQPAKPVNKKPKRPGTIRHLITKERKCLWCEKPLPANANPRMKTHKGECNTMFCREYARNHWREKQGVKKETVLPSGNPANPALTDEQRQKLKANREDILRTINKRIDERQG
jgi:hypothetical protein